MIEINNKQNLGNEDLSRRTQKIASHQSESRPHAVMMGSNQNSISIGTTDSYCSSVRWFHHV